MTLVVHGPHPHLPPLCDIPIFSFEGLWQSQTPRGYPHGIVGTTENALSPTKMSLLLRDLSLLGRYDATGASVQFLVGDRSAQSPEHR